MDQNPLRALRSCGQSAWLDYIRRSFVVGADLRRLVENDGLGGVTSNPTIFEKAIGGSSDYDDQLRELSDRGLSTEDVFQQLAARDVQTAADVLRPVYDETNGHDGFVSIEVSPNAAHDTALTLEDAHTLWRLTDRPNVMIKVPATPEGIPAIEELLFEGINVNITLIFAVEVYEQVMEAYLRGLERRVERGEPIDRLASVASFFVSRVDTLVDAQLDQAQSGTNETRRQELERLKGKAAIANAKIAYERFEAVVGQERFRRLAAKGASVQRPLWASTSTKNPHYPDTMYVTELIGRDTVNTMPPQTMDAFRDHGEVKCDAVLRDVQEAHRVIEELARAGIHMQDVTDQLTREGVKLFQDSLHSLFDTIAEKMAKIQAGEVFRASASLDGNQPAIDSTLQEMQRNHFLDRVWRKDPSLWKKNPAEQSEITDRLGWLHVSDCMVDNLHRFRDLAKWVNEQGFTHAVVLGMGGSSLAPYVLRESFGRQEGFPELLVLDSTDPNAVRHVENMVDPETTLYIVSSKSGTTTEPNAFFQTFWDLVHGRKGDQSGNHFVAITDPGTPLEELARRHKFHDIFLNPADIGGRYSAMSYFGLVPAAVMGLDVGKLLDRSMRMEQACAACVPAEENPGAWLGAIMGDLAGEGRDKVTFFLSEEIQTLGLWLEQLLAESTGKEGKGLVPVPDDPPGAPEAYGGDRLCVYVSLKGSEDPDLDERVAAIERSGQPVVRLQMDDLYDLGAEFFRWEFATGVAGALLGINAFDQPNVQESKDNTKRLLAEYEKSGSLPEPESLVHADGIRVQINDAGMARCENPGGDARTIVRGFLTGVSAPAYIAVMAFVAPSKANSAQLQALRVALRDRFAVATTMGFGPRFLHSTGQLHKGGPPEGIFIQITADAERDVPIPGEKFSYGALIMAQALGDFQALQQHGRPALRLHLDQESELSIERVVRLIEEAAGAQSPAPL